jgi:putative hydrolase of the HAD superfamily
MPTRAVLLDALGTLVELEPPAPLLHAALGGEPDAQDVARAMRVEMAYYRDHSHEAADASSLAALRERCAELLSAELGLEVTVATMMSAIRFRAYADAVPAIEDLRGRGLALVCVSNWDCSLPDVLERVGLAGLLDGVVASAPAGHRKPDPAIFAAGLALAGCAPEEALVVGDTPAEDVEGARAAGIPALLLDRGADPPPEGSDPEGSEAPVISSLTEISHHLRR